MNGVDPKLINAVRSGTYVVDAHAVAGAILSRHEDRREARRLARVLEALERDAAAVVTVEGDSGAHADRA